MTIKKFQVLRKRELIGKVYAEVGDIVYDYVNHDYGLANDDSRLTGIEHNSVTLDPNGVGTPSFTIPVFDLKEIKE